MQGMDGGNGVGMKTTFMIDEDDHVGHLRFTPLCSRVFPITGS